MAEQANYQGEHLGLSLNRDAVFALNDALEQLRYSVDHRTSAAVPLRLPDGRTLQLRLSLTNAGEIRDAHGEYLDDDGIAHGDVTGDLAAHADVRQMLDHVVRPSLMWDLSTAQREGSEPVDVDALAATRADAALEALPFRYGRSQEWVVQLRDRALDFAREELPALLEEDRESLRRVRTARGDTHAVAGRDVGAEAADPAPKPPVAADEDQQRYAYRGSTVGGGDLVERLIADGLASPAARDSEVDDVVWQVTEVNAVDWDDPVDAHDFPRKLSGPADDLRAPRWLPEAVVQTEPSQFAGDDGALPALQPPARPRNRFDDDRRRMTDNARFTRGVAQEQTQRGDTTWAARWADVADGFDRAALGYRRLAITEPAQSSLRAEVAEPGADRGPDTGRTAGSDGQSAGAGMAM